MATEDPQLTTRQILKKVRHIEIRTNRMVTEALAGAYHSVFKGVGIDFEEVREYCVGDDVRAIDWNVTAKMDRPFVKVFREERELTLMLLVDLSGSGVFGSMEQSKRELAAELASVLAFSAVKNNDKVGLILFTDHVECFIAPKKGRQHVLRLIREILFFKPKGRRTNIVQTLDRLNRILKRKAVVFLLSDFLQNELGRLPNFEKIEEDPLFHSLALTNKRHDLICVVLADPKETELPEVGILNLEDAETGETIEVNTNNKRFRMLYSQENEQRQEQFKRALRRLNVDAVHVSTAEPYLKPLRAFLDLRARRF
tara:strand:+ start:43319 stop:44257 length:939 start_codon:yes stop_codon:yes gene_type:complete